MTESFPKPGILSDRPAPTRLSSPWAQEAGQGPRLAASLLLSFLASLTPTSAQAIRSLTIPPRGHQALQARETEGPGRPPRCPLSPTGPSQSSPALVLDIPFQPCPLGLIMASQTKAKFQLSVMCF